MIIMYLMSVQEYNVNLPLEFFFFLRNVRKIQSSLSFIGYHLSLL